jgi:hypothetical protein
MKIHLLKEQRRIPATKTERSWLEVVTKCGDRFDYDAKGEAGQWSGWSQDISCLDCLGVVIDF